MSGIDSTHNSQPLLTAGFFSNIWETLQSWGETSWFAYLTILLLQLKRVWAAWQYRDLTSGDTSAYFMSAYGWVQELSVKIHWSPLYTAFYGTLFKLVPDVYWATLLHRFVIVFALAIMVLALMRRLLPAGLAWLATAWWVILPINFDSLYEVHLFAVLLPLAGTLLVLYKPGIWSRGAALGILLADMVLVRNEIIIALSLWVLVCLVWETRQIRLRRGKDLKIFLLAYGLPVLIAIVSISFFNWRTLVKPGPEDLSAKHTRNVCQIYAFGYQQRHPDWTKSPWTECQELMPRVFGKPQPSMTEAVQSNPRAMLGHLLWNIRLLPAGLQVALFNATSEHYNPDYVPVLLDRQIVLAPSLLALVLVGIGLVSLYRERRYWWESWLKDRIWGWIMLLCLSAVMMVVIPMQRPRPSYMFLLTLFLMAALGMCLFIVTNRLTSYRWFPHLIPVVMIVLLLFTPSYYSAGNRPLLTLYNKLTPSEEFIGYRLTGIVSNGYGSELCHYFTKNSNGGCVGYTYQVFNGLTAEDSVSELLDRQSVPVVALYIEENFLTRYGSYPSIQRFLAHPEQEGWKLVSLQNSSAGRWRVYINVLKLNEIVPSLPITLSDE
jgi:hypothetical protein